MILKKCEKCEVLNINGRQSMLARVSLWRDDITLYFKRFRDLPGAYVKSVTFYDDAMGLVTCQCRLDIHENLADDTGDEEWKAECQILTVQSTMNRKADVRIKISIPMQAFQLSNWGPMPAFEATVRDISAGGVYITTGARMSAGDRIRFHLTINNHDLSLQSEIMRVRLLSDERFGYGCRFSKNVPEGYLSHIRSFVFKAQVERRDYL